MRVKEFVRILRSLGFEIMRESEHTVWGKGDARVVVPHGKIINRMLARKILKKIGYTGTVTEIKYAG